MPHLHTHSLVAEAKQSPSSGIEDRARQLLDSVRVTHNEDNMKRARLVLQLGDEEDVTLIVSGRHDVFGLEGSRGVVIPLSVFLSDSPGVMRARVKSFCETP